MSSTVLPISSVSPSYSTFNLQYSKRQGVRPLSMDRSSAGFPIPHKKLTIDVKGVKTDLVISCYEDHYLVIVTQLGSMGTLLQARKEEGVSVLPTFNVSVVFGKRDEPMLVACARQLIENISAAGSSRSLVLSLGLKDHSVDIIKAIVSAVIENRMW